jgi:hypothetical protein
VRHPRAEVRATALATVAAAVTVMEVVGTRAVPIKTGRTDRLPTAMTMVGITTVLVKEVPIAKTGMLATRWIAKVDCSY